MNMIFWCNIETKFPKTSVFAIAFDTSKFYHFFIKLVLHLGNFDYWANKQAVGGKRKVCYILELERASGRIAAESVWFMVIFDHLLYPGFI